MKKSILSLLLVSLVAFGCTTPDTPKPSVSSSAQPSASASSTPDVTPTPDTSSSTTPSVAPSTSSSTAPANVSCSGEEPVAGTEYESSQLGKFICVTDAKVNSKWTYSMNTMAGEGSVSAQVISIDGNKVTVKTESTIAGKTEVKTVVAESAAGYQQEQKAGYKYKYVGKESVSVPAGTFDSYKFTNSTTENGANIDSVFYISKIRGFVKMIVTTEVPAVNMKMNNEVVLKAFQP